jgi:hypothetical protein
MRHFGHRFIFFGSTIALLAVPAVFWAYTFTHDPSKPNPQTLAPEFQGTQSFATSTNSQLTYCNQRYDFSITLPDGWRVATRLMRAAQPSSFLETYRVDTSDIFLITNMTVASETVLAEQVESITAKGGFVTTEFSTGKIMALAVSELSPEAVRGGVASSVLQAVKLASGLPAVQFIDKGPSETAKPLLQIFVPFYGHVTDGWGGDVRSIRISTTVDESTSKDAFRLLYDSFRYTNCSA